MTNADKFKGIFGIYATELWAKSEKEFLEWLNSDVPDTDDGDTISRQAAIDALGEKPLGDTDLDLGCRNQWEWDTEILKTMPSAQPEIIRCRDCIAYQEGIDIDGKPFTRCNGSVRTYGHTLPDWYCADAERRTDERTD